MSDRCMNGCGKEIPAERKAIREIRLIRLVSAPRAAETSTFRVRRGDNR